MRFITNRGEDLNQIMADEKVLLIFLRHFGCTFCRETMCNLAHARQEIESNGIHIVIVHMVSEEMANQMLMNYDLHAASHISDPELVLYKIYGLQRTGLRSYFGLRNWWRAFVAGLIKGHLIGRPAGDPFQMPGVFFIENSQIRNCYTYRYVSDRPNFKQLAMIGR